MSLKKQTVIDQITVQENGVVEVREVTRVIEGDVEIGRTYHRTTHRPGDDVSAADDRVKSICAAAWTPEIIAAAQQSA